MNDRIEDIRQRVMATTPGEWVVGVRMSYGWPAFVIRDMLGPDEAEIEADRAFIESARMDILWLLNECEYLRGQNAALRREAG